MAIRVKLHGRLRIAAGTDEVRLPDGVSNVGDLLREMTARFGHEIRQYIFDPGTDNLSPSLVVLVNGHSIKMLKGTNTPLMEKDDISIDSVDIMEIVGGG
jgi:molybdopterin converting factor small subunit